MKVKQFSNDTTLAIKASEILDENKAENIALIDVSYLSNIADYFIIAGGTNRNQVQAMCDNVDECLGRAGVHCKQTEGYQNANWILMDFGDVIIHIFDEENRSYYNLERIWRDGKEVEVEDI